MRVAPGAPGGTDDTDVALELFVDDVFTNALADYTGELRAHLTLGATGAAVADPNEGSACNASTSVDALVPGAAPEGRRAVWQLAAVDVYDGGPDGDADTPAGDTLFATQGIFVP